MIIFTVTMLFGGITVINTSQAENNGMPGRVLDGEFGNRINLFDCLLADLGVPGFVCNDIHVSASESNYVQHGWNAFPQELGEGQPLGFQLYLDGEKLNMLKFAQAFRTDEGDTIVLFIFYVIFKPGTLSVDTHTIEGVWTSGWPENEFFSTQTNLVVGA
ncbi:MAG: hypothetical protein HeimC2_41390 [Candidatus Heimdallarchaeota archaeon LC_2]|nr:MAG: hypothetical protein HeimC2_41390 [Candidatus Heimdallarchaeota archaeon LC_2]